jgi:hypothetical protein
MKKRLRHMRSLRAVPVLAALVLSGGALIGATVAAADTAVETTTPFTFGGTNPARAKPSRVAGACISWSAGASPRAG